MLIASHRFSEHALQIINILSVMNYDISFLFPSFLEESRYRNDVERCMEDMKHTAAVLYELSRTILANFKAYEATEEDALQKMTSL